MTLCKSFIKIPLKRTKFISLYQPLKYLVLECNIIDVSEYLQGLEKLDSLRQFLPEMTPSTESLDSLCNYHDMIYFLMQSLPKQIMNKKIPNLTWKPAFPEKGWIFTENSKSTSLEYEQCSVLYCIGAVQTALASSADHSNQEELKKCTNLFQKSAGIFEILADIVEGRLGKKMTEDLTPPFLTAYSSICLFQAHCCVFEKAKSSNASNEILAKIAAEGASLARRAVDSSSAVKVPHDWLPFLQHSQLLFRALADYYQSFSDESRGAYGLRVTRLKVAARCSTKTRFLDDNFLSELYSKARKENDMIYHDTEPSEASIPPVAGVSIVKTIPPLFPFTSLSNPFSEITSHAILRAKDRLKELWDTFVACSSSRLHQKADDLEEILKKFYLPAILESSDSATPECVLRMSHQVRSSAGDVEENILKLSQNHQHALKLIDQSGGALTQEQSFDDIQRSIYRSYWNRMASSNLTSSFWSQLRTLEKRVETAHVADNTISDLFSGCKDVLEILQKPDDELEYHIPSLSTVNPANTQAVSQLRSLMAVVEEQKQSLNLMEHVLNNADFGPHVARFKERERQNIELKVDAEFELMKDSYSTQVDSIIDKFDDFIGQIESICSDNSFAVSQGFSQNTFKHSREEFVTYLSSGFEKFQKVTFHISEGLTFYSTIVNFLERLNSNIQDYCYSRSLEGQDLIERLQNEPHLFPRGNQGNNPPYPYR